jgi:ribonuclease G
VEPVAAEESAVTLEAGAEVKTESAEGAPAAPAPAASQPQRFEDGDGRDRRGRRSRRRRNRGRGFPESKYAPADSRYAAEPAREPKAAEETAAAEARVAGPEVEASRSDFAVLPGESLAKYSRANIQPLDEAEEEEVRSLQETEVVAEPESSSEAALEAEEPAVVEERVIAEEADAPEVTALISEPEESAPETGNAAAAESEESEPEIPTEIQAAVEAETVIEAEAQRLESTETEPQAAEAAPSETPAPQLSAQVREQGGRYMHRVTRRMRRRMRGSGSADRGDAAPGAETVVARPEPQRAAGRPERTPSPSITELLKESQEIIVQIAKEPLGQKGARITSHIALPGRYVVYMPTVEHTGVSRKIASDEERHRLKRILQVHHVGIPGGFIVRTAGEGKREDEIAADMNFLANLWLDIRQKAEKKPAPLLLHHDLDIVQRILRDQVTDQFKAVWVDNEEMYESVLGFVQRFQPALVNRVKLYTRSAPIFDAFNITAELEKALRPKVWLKSGGHIVINQTEALVAIDVNTGKYVGRSNRLEDTIVKTNTEAVKEIVRQIRLRDLGGIIVVDFIDMDERKNRQKVMQALEDAMRVDRAPYKILQFNDFGLVAITRKRVKQSLERALCMPCPHCEGAGYVKSVPTIVSEILQEAHKIAGAIEGKDVMLRVHPEVAKFLKSNQNKYLEELEEILRRPVLVKSDPLLHHEKFDLT